MGTSGNRRRLITVAVVVSVIAVLGGTSYAATRPSHNTRSPHASQPLTKGDVKKLVRGYVTKHAAAKPIPFAQGIDSSESGGPVAAFGPWTLTMTCDAKGASVGVTGPGVEAGTNTLGTTNGGPGASFETFGGTGGTNGIGQGAQGSQTLMLVDSGTEYTVTYIANADNNTPTQCDVVGYALQIS